MQSIHSVFHVSQLEVAPPNTIPDQINPPPPPVEVDSEIEYKITQILNSKMDYRRRPPLMYYIQWAGYKGIADEYSWLNAWELNNAVELVQDFHVQYPNKPGLYCYY